jgi:hypothetical protein
LDGFPITVNEEFSVIGSKIENLKGLPFKIYDRLHISSSVSLKDTDDISKSCPQVILKAPSINLTALPSDVETLSVKNLVDYSKIVSLGQSIDDLKIVENNIEKIKPLHFFKMENLKIVHIYSSELHLYKEQCKIINGHLNGDRDIISCQEDLINGGFKDWAKM